MQSYEYCHLQKLLCHAVVQGAEWKKGLLLFDFACHPCTGTMLLGASLRRRAVFSRILGPASSLTGHLLSKPRIRQRLTALQFVNNYLCESWKMKSQINITPAVVDCHPSPTRICRTPPTCNANNPRIVSPVRDRYAGDCYNWESPIDYYFITIHYTNCIHYIFITYQTSCTLYSS